MNKDLLKKGAFCVFALLLVSTMIFWMSGALFMKFFNLPIGQSRPWTIFQYWSMYHQSASKVIRLALNGCLFLPWMLLGGFGIFIWFQKNKKELHGAARFASFSEIKKAGLINPEKGLDRTILVGKYKNQFLTYGGNQFVLLAAPTRSGKGVGVVIPNCLNYSDSLVVLDIKGENFDITSGFRKLCGQEVYLFSPYDEDGKTHRYNPLDYVRDDPAERLGDIDAIGQALYSGESNSDKFWSENAKDFFRGVSLFVLESPELPNTLGEILRQASGKGKPVKEHLLGKLKEAQEAGRPYSSTCVDALNRVLSNSDNTLAGIVATFNTALLSFQNPKVDLATSASDFDLREVRRKRMSIYFKIEPTKLKDARVLINLFFDQLLNLNTRKLPSQDKSLKYQCLVLLDEMTSIGTVNMIKQAVSYMAGYNMRLLTIIQNKSQLEDVYGKAGAVTLLSNHALMIMYAPSPTTQDDANQYSEMLGYQTVKSKSRSSGKGGSSTSESDQRRALMLPQEIRELGKENEIVTLENTKPIFCQKIEYWSDPVFEPRVRKDVPEIPKQDVKLFVAQLEQRIRPATAGELKQPDIAASIVTGDTSLPEDMKNLPDNQWDQEQVESYLENVMSSSVPQAISNFDALRNIRPSVVTENLGTMERMNTAASAQETAITEISEENAAGSENSEDDLASVMEEFELSDPAADEISVTAEISENTVTTEETQVSEDLETAPQPETHTERTVEANVSANVAASGWTQKQSAQFVSSLVDEIRKQLTPVKQESPTTDSENIPNQTENLPAPNTDKKSSDFKNIQKIRSSYRKVGRHPLNFRSSV